MVIKKNGIKRFLEIASTLLVVVLFGFLIFRLVPQFEEIIGDLSTWVELVATSLIILFQIILKIANTEEVIKRKLLVGYWIYYSLEEVDG